MPNWCYNTIQVDGDRPELEKFIEKASFAGDEETSESFCLSFKKFKPYPNGEWSHGWCAENWGTKWDACDPYLEDGGGQDIMYSFNSAWSPPTPIVQMMIYINKLQL